MNESDDLRWSFIIIGAQRQRRNVKIKANSHCNTMSAELIYNTFYDLSLYDLSLSV